MRSFDMLFWGVNFWSREFWGVLIFAPIRSSTSLEIRNTPWERNLLWYKKIKWWIIIEGTKGKSTIQTIVCIFFVCSFQSSSLCYRLKPKIRQRSFIPPLDKCCHLLTHPMAVIMTLVTDLWNRGKFGRSVPHFLMLKILKMLKMH